MPGTPSPDNISTKQRRIAELARQMPDQALKTLNHYLDMDWMREAWRRTRKDGAVGVDGQDAEAFEANLELNLQRLLSLAKSGEYRAPPVRRVHIPKGDGSLRPLGIPTLADKVLQRAIVMLLEPIYENDFAPFSYGFRPGRSAHQALDAIWQQLTKTRGGWVLDADIRKFFDMLDHQQLTAILRQRVADGVILRLIGKWLNAGVLDEGRVTHPETGTPQGGVISPLLANIYLHEVLDRWFTRDVVPRLSGQVFMVRYADDFVMGFTEEADAHRVMKVLPLRFGKYGLAVHPEKTRIVPFRPPGPNSDSEPGSFDFLGFNHHWALSVAGRWYVKRKTMAKRLTRALDAVKEWCRMHMHEPIMEQYKGLAQKLRGHYGYYGIIGNSKSLYGFRSNVQRIWRYWLNRRSQKARMTWERFWTIMRKHELPRPTSHRQKSLQRRAKPNP